jgi:alkylhydroperoxidase family enzyme
MSERHTTNIRRLTHAVLNSPGDTDTTTRRAVEEYCARLSGSSTRRTAGDIPTDLANYLNKLALHAYKTTDEDIQALRQAGYSEDAIFEITLSAALGAGLARLERGLSALKGEQE